MGSGFMADAKPVEERGYTRDDSKIFVFGSHCMAESAAWTYRADRPGKGRPTGDRWYAQHERECEEAQLSGSLRLETWQDC